MFIMQVITTPIYLVVSSLFAPIITKLAIEQKTLDVPAGQFLTFYGTEGPELRWALIKAANLMQEGVIVLIPIIVFTLLFIWTAKYMKKKDEQFEIEENLETQVVETEVVD